jgi:hypothetical protein
MLVLSPSEAEQIVGSASARADLSVLLGTTMVGVDLRASPCDTAPVDLSLWGTVPVILAGIGTTADVEAHDSIDVIVDDEDALARLDEAVGAHPHASIALVQLLRLQRGLDPYDALVAESLAYATLQGGQEFVDWLHGRGSRVRRPTTEPPLLVERHGNEVTLTFNRPRLFNLYDAATRDALRRAADDAVDDPTIEHIVLRGIGKAFCAGGDPAEFGTTRDTALAHLVRSTANAAPPLLALAPRLTASVHGACVGAGIELAAFAHRVIATRTTFFELPEVTMGLVPGAGGTVSLARRIGRHRTAWLAITGDRLDAETALQWGLVDELA